MNFMEFTFLRMFFQPRHFTCFRVSDKRTARLCMECSKKWYKHSQDVSLFDFISQQHRVVICFKFGEYAEVIIIQHLFVCQMIFV